MSIDKTRVTNLVITMKNGEGARIKCGDTALEFMMSEGSSNSERRIYFSAPENVEIRHLDRLGEIKQRGKNHGKAQR